MNAMTPAFANPRKASGARDTLLIGVLMPALALGLAGCQSAPDAKAPAPWIEQALASTKPASPATPVRPAPLPPGVSDALLMGSAPVFTSPAPLLEPRFDLAVTNAPAAQVFQAIASGSRYSLLLPPSLTGQVSVNLKEVTAREALDTLRELYGYEYRIDGTRVFIQQASLSTRVFQIAYPSARRQGRSDTRVVSGSIVSAQNQANGGGASQAPPGSSVSAGSLPPQEGSQVSTSIEADFWKEVDMAVKAVVGNAEGRQVVLSPHSGVMVVRAFPREMREVESYLRLARIAVQRQVMLEAKIVEVALREGYESGINWAAFDRAGNHRWSMGADPSRINVPGSLGRAYGVGTGSVVTGVDASTTPATVLSSTLGQLLSSPLAQGSSGALGLAFTANSFTSLLAFLETQGQVQVLSSPRVAATNNQKAVLRVGSDDFFITNISTTTTTSGAGGTTVTPTIQTQAFFSGISLDVTPQIDEQGMVTLHVRPSVSSVSERTRVVNMGNMGSFTLPLASANVHEADTVVRVADGVTVAIGGLMSQSQVRDDQQVPGVGQVPAVGEFFKRNNRQSVKRELVFLLKPTVIKGDGSQQWAAQMAGTQERVRGLLSAPIARSETSETEPGNPALGQHSATRTQEN